MNQPAFGKVTLIPHTLTVDLNSNTISVMLNVDKDVATVIRSHKDFSNLLPSLLHRKGRRCCYLSIATKFSGAKSVMDQALAALRDVQLQVLLIQDIISFWKQKAIANGVSPKHWLLEMHEQPITKIIGEEDHPWPDPFDLGLEF